MTASRAAASGRRRERPCRVDPCPRTVLLPLSAQRGRSVAGEPGYLRPPQLKAGVTVAEEGRIAEHTRGSGKDFPGTGLPARCPLCRARMSGQTLSSRPWQAARTPRHPQRMPRLRSYSLVASRPGQSAKHGTMRIRASVFRKPVPGACHHSPRAVVPKVKCNAQGHASGNSRAGFKPRNGLGAGGFFLVF